MWALDWPDGDVFKITRGLERYIVLLLTLFISPKATFITFRQRNNKKVP